MVDKVLKAPPKPNPYNTTSRRHACVHFATSIPRKDGQLPLSPTHTQYLAYVLFSMSILASLLSKRRILLSQVPGRISLRLNDHHFNVQYMRPQGVLYSPHKFSPARTASPLCTQIYSFPRTATWSPIATLVTTERRADVELAHHEYVGQNSTKLHGINLQPRLRGHRFPGTQTSTYDVYRHTHPTRKAGAFFSLWRRAHCVEDSNQGQTKTNASKNRSKFSKNKKT